MDPIVHETRGQPFPAIYSSGLIPFKLGNQTSGAAGARATHNFTLNTNPGAIYGIRIASFYEIPNNPSANLVALFDYLSRVTDLQQSVAVQVAQQTMTLSSPAPQAHIAGTSFVYYDFPEPFGPLQGSNNVKVDVTRLTSYPSYLIGEVEFAIEPQIEISLLGRLDVSSGPAPGNRRLS